MALLLAGLGLFIGIHCVSIINENFRNRMVDKIGEYPWKAIYSLVSIIGFILLVKGYGIAREDQLVLFSSPAWLTGLSMILLLPVFPLLIAAYLPGKIKKRTSHPMLLATKLWAFSHLIINGTMANLILFGTILIWGVVDRISLERRPVRTIPAAGYGKYNDFIAVGAGLLVYGGFIFGLHTYLIGVPLV